jgi:hypothetical protein
VTYWDFPQNPGMEVFGEHHRTLRSA